MALLYTSALRQLFILNRFFVSFAICDVPGFFIRCEVSGSEPDAKL